MCRAFARRDEERDESHRLQGTLPWDFEERIRELEDAHRTWHRRALIRRLTNDPFYQLMDLSTACRMWMMRYMKNMAFVAEVYYRMTLLEYFETKDPKESLEFLQIHYAPDEMIALWERLHPVVEKTESDLPTPTTEADQPS